MKRKADSIVVSGAGWIQGGRCGGYRRIAARTLVSPDPGELARDKELFAAPPKNFARFDAVSRMACCVCALALKDAGMGAGAGGHTGLFGTNENGCLETNAAYFKDYVQAGRILARGNLFIYTLPSSPLAEAAICFRLTGPILYWGFPGDAGRGAALAEVAGLAANAVEEGTADSMLAMNADEQAGLCLVLRRGGEGDPAEFGVARVRARLEQAATAGDAAAVLAREGDGGFALCA